MKSRKKRETEGSEMNGEANEENKDDDQDEDRIGKVQASVGGGLTGEQTIIF